MGLYGIPIRIGDAASIIPTILSQHGYMATKERGNDIFVCDTKRGQARFWISKSVPQRWYASLNAPNEEIAATLEKAGVFMDLKEYFAKHHGR
jgi:hypothetical protein